MNVTNVGDAIASARYKVWIVYLPGPQAGSTSGQYSTTPAHVAPPLKVRTLVMSMALA